jgi:hypothetical protein
VNPPVAIGFVQQDASIDWPGQSYTTGLSYYPDQGLVIDREQLKSTGNEDSDEPCD